MAAYCRVSTDQEEQLLSYENQVNYYTKFIKDNPLYTFAGVYADEGISATNTKKREEFNRMIADCRDGKIDMIITKSISRFARHVGCRDFKALKALVMEQASGPAVKLAGTLHQETCFSPQNWLMRQQEYLEKTAQLISTQEFEAAVDAICSAQRVFLHGKNASAALAQLLYFRLRRLGVQVSLLPSGGSELLEGLIQAGKTDLVVLFSFSKLSREGRILLEQSRVFGYHTLAFVGRTCLPAEERAEISLFAYRGTEKEYHSMAAPAALVDALVIAVTERLGAKGTERLQALHRLKKAIFPEG